MEMIETDFRLSLNTKVNISLPGTPPIRHIREIFARDMRNVLIPAPSSLCPENEIRVKTPGESGKMPPESYKITFENDRILTVTAAEPLGAIYALLSISEKALKIPPFWFYNDYRPKKVKYADIPLQAVRSPRFRVRYRGWFINDEVLTTGWHDDSYDPAVWEPAFEALLRCGGNMVIPGTGVTQLNMEQLAADMGLILTQHHAEPLGAEMFSAAYPDCEASYDKHPELFEKLWRDAILRQKDTPVVWSLGFRGQGDLPFWENDPAYGSPQARGALISRIISLQYKLISEYVSRPVCCTNLYGEIMQLYKDGYIKIPEGIIKIWADNGYGKMVSRRQGNRNPRVYALPTENDAGPHGIYYHVTFHDLQASNHLTMMPNSPDFIAGELKAAFAKGADRYLIVNSGNIRMHAYPLDLVGRLWKNGDADTQAHLSEYTRTYFPEGSGHVADCIRSYFDCTVPYGPHPDDRAGEQYYHYPARAIVSHWIRGNSAQKDPTLQWMADAGDFPGQVESYRKICFSGLEKWERQYSRCLKAEENLKQSAKAFDDGILLQTVIHLTGCAGAVHLCNGYRAFLNEDYVHAFLFACESMESYKKGYEALGKAEHDKWHGFYRNDCLTNMKLTVRFLDILRKYIRMIGDSNLFLNWERKYIWPDSKKKVMLQTTVTPQLDEDQLYRQLKNRNI